MIKNRAQDTFNLQKEGGLHSQRKFEFDVTETDKIAKGKLGDEGFYNA